MKEAAVVFLWPNKNTMTEKAYQRFIVSMLGDIME